MVYQIKFSGYIISQNQSINQVSINQIILYQSNFQVQSGIFLINHHSGSSIQSLISHSGYRFLNQGISSNQSGFSIIQIISSNQSKGIIRLSLGISLSQVINQFIF